MTSSSSDVVKSYSLVSTADLAGFLFAFLGSTFLGDEPWGGVSLEGCFLRYKNIFFLALSILPFNTHL